jgi:hypothetical protein
MMTDLLLRRASEIRPGADGLDDYDVIGEDGTIIGHIFKSIAAPIRTPWAWTMAYGHQDGRTTTHGYAPTREAAMAAFKRSWRRE